MIALLRGFAYAWMGVLLLVVAASFTSFVRASDTLLEALDKMTASFHKHLSKQLANMFGTRVSLSIGVFLRHLHDSPKPILLLLDLTVHLIGDSEHISVIAVLDSVATRQSCHRHPSKYVILIAGR